MERGEGGSELVWVGENVRYAWSVEGDRIGSEGGGWSLKFKLPPSCNMWTVSLIELAECLLPPISYLPSLPLPHLCIAAIPPNSTFAPPLSYVYTPNYCQYFYESLGRNRERNLGHIANVTFNKQEDHTALRLTWEGNFRKQRCSICCTQWFITIDGAPCTSFEKVETNIVSRTAYNIFFPTTITGICHEVDGVPLAKGPKLLKLEVGNCETSPIADGAAGFSQSSRFIVEEIPRGMYGTFALFSQPASCIAFIPYRGYVQTYLGQIA